jgi:glycosyltransferase involved in cell wall biosynthesis
MNAVNPLVSIVIPTHNRAHILKECLESVVRQTYDNIEVVVVNDNSTDNTEEILKEYASLYNFFKYYQSSGIGGNAARNLGVKKAAGDYIAFMDDDDICELFRIEAQMKPILESSYKYNFVISSFYIFNSQGKKIEQVDFLKPLDSVGFTVRWLIKKSIIEKAGGFDTRQPALQDVEFFWRLKEYSNIYFSPQTVVRVRDSSISITKDHSKMINAISRLLELHGSKMRPYERNYWTINLCKKYAYQNDWDNYRLSFKKLNKIKMPVSAIMLFFIYQLKNTFLIKVHSKLLYKSFRLKNFFKRISHVFL